MCLVMEKRTYVGFRFIEIEKVHGNFKLYMK
jgi:hypothetical protein